MSAVSVELEYGCPKVCVRVRIGAHSDELPEGGLDFAIANPVHKFEVCLERVELVGPSLEEELEAGMSVPRLHARGWQLLTLHRTRSCRVAPGPSSGA